MEKHFNLWHPSTPTDTAPSFVASLVRIAGIVAMVVASRPIEIRAITLTPLAVALLLGGVPSADAQSTSLLEPITIVGIEHAAGGQVLFNQITPRTGLSPCAASNSNRWAFSTSTSAGQATLAVVLSAYSTGRPVQVYGTGTCDVWADTESVRIVVMK